MIMAKTNQKNNGRRKPMVAKGGYTTNSKRRYDKGGKLNTKKHS